MLRDAAISQHGEALFASWFDCGQWGERVVSLKPVVELYETDISQFERDRFSAT